MTRDPHCEWLAAREQKRQPKADPVPRWIGAAIVLWIVLVVIARYI